MDETGNKGQRQQKTRKARTQRRKGRKTWEASTSKKQSIFIFSGIAGNNDVINLPPLVREVDSCDRVGP